MGRGLTLGNRLSKELNSLERATAYNLLKSSSLFLIALRFFRLI